MKLVNAISDRLRSDGAVSYATLSKSICIIRLMVGLIFLAEGLQKFLFADNLGAGRFAKIGLPIPDILGPLVGTFEIACGLCVVLGFLTRLAVVPLIIIMLTAIITTKVPFFINDGFWKMAHEARTDLSMLLGCIFLLINGGGLWAIENRIAKKISPGARS